MKVPESSKVGSRIDIKNCLAFDVDGDKISYEIVNSSSSIPSPLLKKFKLIKETQDTYLKLLQPLDYENKNKNSQQNSGTFILIADDGVNQSNEKVVLEVTDINDNVPVFGEKVSFISKKIELRCQGELNILYLFFFFKVKVRLGCQDVRKIFFNFFLFFFSLLDLQSKNLRSYPA